MLVLPTQGTSPSGPPPPARAQSRSMRRPESGMQGTAAPRSTWRDHLRPPAGVQGLGVWAGAPLRRRVFQV